MVVLVIRHCVNVTKAKMEMARLVKEDGLEVDPSVGCKAADSLLTLVTMYTPTHTNVDGHFCRGRWCQHGTT